MCRVGMVSARSYADLFYNRRAAALSSQFSFIWAFNVRLARFPRRSNHLSFGYLLTRSQKQTNSLEIFAPRRQPVVTQRYTDG
jgi:hypothetical protein